MNMTRKIWIDAPIVIVISLAVGAALYLPFENTLPILPKLFIKRFTSFFGYLFLSYLIGRVNIWYLAKVSLAVWATLTPIFFFMYWQKLKTGTIYTIGLFFLEYLIIELIAVLLAVITYNFLRTLKIDSKQRDA